MPAPVPTLLRLLAQSPAPAPAGLLEGLVAVAESGTLSDPAPLRNLLIGRLDVPVEVADRLRRQAPAATRHTPTVTFLGRGDVPPEQAAHLLTETDGEVHRAVATATSDATLARLLLTTSDTRTLVRLTGNASLPMPLRVESLTALTSLPAWTKALPRRDRWNRHDNALLAPISGYLRQAADTLDVAATDAAAHLLTRFTIIDPDALDDAATLLLARIDDELRTPPTPPAPTPNPSTKPSTARSRAAGHRDPTSRLNASALPGCRQLLQALSEAPRPVRHRIGAHLRERDLTCRHLEAPYGLDNGAHLRQTARRLTWQYLTEAQLRDPDTLEALAVTLSDAFAGTPDAWATLAALGQSLSGPVPEVADVILALHVTADPSR